MRLLKEDNTSTLSGNIGIKDRVEMIGLMVNIYQSFLVPFDDWLTKQEKRFFIASVIIANQDLKYTSSKAKKIFREVFNLKRQSDVRGYLVDLEQKGFLTSDVETKTISISEFFKLNLKEHQVKIQINLDYKEDEN